MSIVSPDGILQFALPSSGTHQHVVNAWLRKRVPTFEDGYTGPELPADAWDRLLAAMNHTNCVGLSANQIGISARAFITRINGRETRVLDPIVRYVSDDDEEVFEGCMSVGDGKFQSTKPTSRPYSITAEYTIDNTRHVEVLFSMEARVFLHEYDHLNGFIFTDHEVISKGLRNQLILTAGLFEPAYINWVANEKGRSDPTVLEPTYETMSSDYYAGRDTLASHLARRLSGSFDQRLKYMIDSNYYEEIEAW